MAFLPDEQNLQNQGGQAGQGPAQAATQGPITSSPAPTTGGSAKTLNQASSSAPAQPFTNLQSYLTANAPQIQQQGDQIASSLTGQYGQTTGAIDAAKNSFQGDVSKGYAPLDAQVVNNFSTDPAAVAADPTAAAKFKGMYNDSYTGPGSFEGTDQYGALNNQVLQSTNAANQVSTPGGLQSYLMGANPNETQGMATLDSSLVGASPEASQTIQNAATPFKQLPSYLSSAVTGADQSVAAARTAAQGVRDTASAAADTANTGLSKSLADSLAAAQGAFTQNQNNYANDYNAFTTMRGLPDQIHTVAPSYVQPTIEAPVAPTGSAPSYASVASKDDFARSDALKALAGLSSPLDGQDPNTPAFDSTYGGTYSENAAGTIANQLFSPTFTTPANGTTQLDQILAILNGYNKNVPLSSTAAPVTLIPSSGGGMSTTTTPVQTTPTGRAAR